MNGQEETEDYKVIGTVFLILAFIVLIGAFTMRGVESWHGARLALIIFGVALTFLGGFICFQKGGKEKMEKKSMLVVSMIAIIVLTQIPVSLVHAVDTRLPPLISGSDCDPTTFDWDGHTIAEGFAVSISADLPIPAGTGKQIKFGCAVAGLGDPWIESGGVDYFEVTPYAKEMWVKVEGDDHYTCYTGSIYDNTGTGESSCGLFAAVMLGVDVAFAAWQIYDWLAEIYQEPLYKEFQPEYPGHWCKAITRQVTPIEDSDPRLQTTTANVLGYFEEGCSRILTVTAQAEIYIQIWDVINNVVSHMQIGTYSVSFEVFVGNPVCAMKPEFGYPLKCYIPDLPVTKMKIELLFDTHDLEGDQTGGESPYGSIDYWPNGQVGLTDLTLLGETWQSEEGDENWEYMADVVPNGKVDLDELFVLSRNWMKTGDYSTDLTDITVVFYLDEGYVWLEPDATGFVTIPENAVTWQVFYDIPEEPRGVLVTFWN